MMNLKEMTLEELNKLEKDLYGKISELEDAIAELNSKREDVSREIFVRESKEE